MQDGSGHARCPRERQGPLWSKVENDKKTVRVISWKMRPLRGFCTKAQKEGLLAT